ncbi:MAG: hypothetical protein P1V20_27390 [Verrucomicrobiales bacterium]|nr:hypothetical protein [Verrucomicrobiales bacterium]
MIRDLRRYMRKMRRGKLRRNTLEQRSRYPADRFGGIFLFVVGAAVIFFSAKQALIKEESLYEDGRRVRPSRLDHDPYYEKVVGLVEQGLIDLGELAQAAKDPVEKDAQEFSSLIPYGVDENQLLKGKNRLFYQRSPLRDDIIRLLQGAAQSTFGWNIRRDRLHIDRNRRKIGTPFYRGHSWTGKLLYRSDHAIRKRKDDAVDESQLELRVIFDDEEQMSHKLRIADKYPAAEDWGYAEFGDPFPVEEAHKGYRFNGRPRQPGDTPPNVLETYVTQQEDQLILNLLIPGTTSHFSILANKGWTKKPGPAGTVIHSIAVGGDKIPEVRFRKEANPGESPRPLYFRVLTAAEARENPYYWQTTATSQDAFSFSHFHDGIARRVRKNDDLPHSLEFLKSLDDSIAQIFLEQERNGRIIDNTLKKQDFILTIDPSLQSSLEGVVSSARGGRHLEIAVSLMNENGEVLAVADSVFPGTGGADFLSTRPRYRLNRNFWEHPVGSSGKPYLYTSGIHANSDLRSFVLPRKSSSMGSILGYSLPKSTIPTLHTSGVFPGAGSKRSDFAAQADEAFARSSNAFFMAHMLAALASKGDGELPTTPSRRGTYQVGDKVLREGPDLSRFLRSDPRVLSGMVGSPFVQALNSVFGIRVSLGDGPFSHANVDEGYRELVDFFAKLDLEKEQLTPYLAGSAPEHSRLVFSDNMRIGHDFLYIVIGGANFGRWTNLDIARCMTRLATGKAVQTTLVRTPVGGRMPPPVEWPPIALSKENHEWMRERLQAPGRGTAGHLKRNVPGGYRLFAKTGTFRINIPSARRGNYNMITFYLEPELTPEGEPNHSGKGGLCAVVSVNSPTAGFNGGLWKRVIDQGLVSTMVKYMEGK